MAKRGRWTDEKVRGFKLDLGQTEVRKSIEPGLYLHIRARASGEPSKHWQYRAQVAGKRRWLSLGTYPKVTLAQARAELQRLQSAHELAKKGEADHPVLEARNTRRTAKLQPTVSEAFAIWIEDKRLGSPRKGGAPVRERTIAVLAESFNGDIRSRIGDVKVEKLSPDAIRSCIDAPRRRGSPGAASHVYKTLRGLVSFCIKRGFISTVDPMRGIENPRPYRPAPPNFADDAELKALYSALEESSLWPSTSLAIELQLFTGARPGEARLARWSEFDLNRSLWTIPAERTKMGRIQRIHLSAGAKDILSRAKLLRDLNCREQGSQEDLVFPGAKGRAMEKMAIARALSRLAPRIETKGGKRLRPNDLRKTARTAMSRIGIPPHIAEQCIAHQEKEILRRVYDGHSYDADKKEAWERLGAHLQALKVGGAEVIPINSHKAA